MNSEKTCCSCQDALIIDRRKAQSYMIGALALGCFIFVVGYFLGKKIAAENFKEDVEHQAFADHIQHSMHVLYNPNPSPTAVSEETKAEPVNAQETTDVVAQGDAPDTSIKPEPVSYYAQLVTYHSPVHAQKLIDRLNKKGIKASMVKQINKAQNGKTIRRYQVVTAPYDSKQELDTIVEMLKKTERITHAKVVLYKAALKGINS
jgi:hypothetical protein